MEPLFFISTTTADLIDAANQVSTLLQARQVQSRLRTVHSSHGGDLREGLRRMIAGCDKVIQLVGFRYGLEPETADPDFGRVSYTQFEGKYAESIEKPIYYILLGESFPTKPTEPETEERRVLQVAYRESIRTSGVQYGTADNPAELELEIRRMEDEIKEYRLRREAATQQTLAAIAELRNSIASFAAVDVYLEPARPGRELSWLRYYSQVCPELVAREDDLRFLREFRDHPDPFRWTFLTGSGGSGKTRLAWEFILETLKDETNGPWLAGFVKEQSLPNTFSRWNPEQNVLLVLDYAGERAEAADEILRAWLDAPGSAKRRLLLLDRTYHHEFDVAKILVSPGADATDRRLGCFSGEVETLRGIRPRRLAALSADDMVRIFGATFQTIRREVPSEEDLTAAFDLFDEQWRPANRHALFSSALGYLVAQGSDVRVSELRKENILTFLLDRQEEVWRRLSPAPSEDDRNLVFAGTVARGIDDRMTRDNELFRAAHYNVAAAMAGEPVDPVPLRSCRGIFPDLVGEAYVAARLAGEARGAANAADVEGWSAEILDWLLGFDEVNYEGLCRERDGFLALLAEDFLDDPVVRQTLEARFAGLQMDLQRVVLRRAYAADATFAERLAVWCRTHGREELLKEIFVGATSEQVEVNQDQVEREIGPDLQAFLYLVEQRLTSILGVHRTGRTAEALEQIEVVGKFLADPPDPSWRSHWLFRRTEARLLVERSDYRWSLGQRAGALYDEGRALGEFEEIASLRNEVPESLRDVSVSLNKVGDVLLSQGDVAGALSRYERSLDLGERILEIVGEVPESLRDVSVSLDRVADVLRSQGDVAGALSRYERSLDLRERTLEIVGEVPESLRDVSVSLDRVADILRSQGDVAGALSRYERSLDLSERILEIVGEVPESLRDVSISLNKVGDVLLSQGDVAGALSRYERSLELRERILEIVGEVPESLRTYRFVLNELGT